MPISDPWPSGPIWIDPRYYDHYRGVPWGGWRDYPTTIPDIGRPRPYSPPVDEERIRKIVREEIAELPIPFDIPDTPPEDTDA